MRPPVRNLFFAILAFVVISCSQKKQPPVSALPLSSPKSEIKKAAISLVGEIVFRRTFADAQFMKDEKEISRYYDRQEKSNPEMIQDPDSLRKSFEDLHFVKGDDLLLSRFRFYTKKEAAFSCQSGKILTLHFERSTVKPEVRISMVGKPDSIYVPFDEPLAAIRYTFSNIIPGGNRELIVLNEYHIMNGDNFDFTVYQITDN
jgi:hypothetical protein